MGLLRIDALAEIHIDQIIQACRDWEELAPFGAPYWRPRSAAELRRKIADTSGSSLASAYSFVIYDHDLLVGECSLHGIDWRNRVASIGICIWNPALRRSGYGQYGSEQMINWAFNHLGMLRIEAWINEGNEPSLGLIKRLGFTYEGLLRERHFETGSGKDVHVLSLLHSEYVSDQKH